MSETEHYKSMEVINMPIWIIVSFTVFSVLCIFAVAKLFGRGTVEYAKAALGSYLIYTVVFVLIWIFSVSVPAYIVFIAMLTTLFTVVLGHYAELYVRSKTFDRYLHAFGSFSLALFLYCILDDFVMSGGSVLFRALFIFLLGNTAGVVFELFEAACDAKGRAVKSQKGLKDTDMDMLFNLIGSLLAGAFAYFWILV